MKLSRIIISLLIVSAALVSGYTFWQTEARERNALASAQQAVSLEKDRVGALKKALERQAALEESKAALSARMIGDNPFADMERELAAAAAKAQVELKVITLTGAVGVEGMKGVGQYAAEVEVTGAYPHFVAFIRLLEEHRLLLQIPDLELEPADTAPFTVRFTMNFYRAMADPPSPPAAKK